MLLEARVDRPITEREAEQLAREFYGVEGSAKSLPGEYDDNFHLTPLSAASGSPAAGFVLKIMHPAREGSLIDLQCRALQHLAQRAPQLTLPRVCATRDGDSFKTIIARDGSQRLLWMLTFVPGKVLAEARPHSA